MKRSTLGSAVVRVRAGFPLAFGLFALYAPSALGQGRSQRTEQYLQAYHDMRRFNGAALVVDGGDVLFDGPLGFARLDPEEPIEPDARFRIGSLTRQFTAALILRLQEEGMLDLDQPVGRYIEEYPSPGAERITLRHLLTQTSGLPDDSGLPPEPGFSTSANLPSVGGGEAHTPFSPAAPLSAGQFVARIWSEPLAFEPGERFESSGSGYVLLGWIAERVTGLSYAEALARYVLEPLGLERTGDDPETEPSPGRVIGYERTLTGYDPAPPGDPSLLFSAGTLYSTLGDLARWTGALLGWDGSSPFRDPASRDRMLTPEVQGHAYGIEVIERSVGREEHVRVIEQAGSICEFGALIRAFPNEHRLIILLDNTSSDLRPIAEGLTNLLWGAEAVLPKPSIAERILPIVESAGVEPALARYRDWRRSRPDQYDYGPGQLLALANHFRERDPGISIAILEALTDDDPEMPAARVALADLYARQGERDRAVEQLEAALTFHPGLPRLLERIVALGAEPDPPLRLPVVSVDPEHLRAVVGQYRIDPATTLSVEMDGDELLAGRTEEPAFRLLPQSSTLFLLHGSHVQLSFDVTGGVASAVSVLESGRRVTFTRIP